LWGLAAHGNTIDLARISGSGSDRRSTSNMGYRKTWESDALQHESRRPMLSYCDVRHDRLTI